MSRFSHKQADELYNYIIDYPCFEEDLDEGNIKFLGSGGSRMVFGFTSSDDGLDYAIKIPYRTSDENVHYDYEECEEASFDCNCLWDDNGFRTQEYSAAKDSWMGQNISEAKTWESVKDIYSCFLEIVEVGDDFNYIVMPQAKTSRAYHSDFSDRATSRYEERYGRSSMVITLLFEAMVSVAEGCGFDYNQSFSIALDLVERASDAEELIADVATRNLGIFNNKGYILDYGLSGGY